jgi:hypothetical protein
MFLAVGMCSSEAPVDVVLRRGPSKLVRLVIQPPSRIPAPREGGYELEQPGECKLVFPAWEWAEWDRRRLVWAYGDCLRAARVGIITRAHHR